MANQKFDVPINEKIRVSELMVIGPSGEQMGMKKIGDALTLANYAGLDLVLMNPNANPPIGKIMDYNRYRYEKQKQQKDNLKKQRESNKAIKEYQLTVGIGTGDFDTRRRNAESYLIKGHKIKVTLLFRGRQMAHQELGYEIFEKFAAALEEVSVIESTAKLEGRRITMILAPKVKKENENAKAKDA